MGIDLTGNSYADSSQTTDNPPHTYVPQPITRVSKACEPCRIRKTKCDIATRSICSECSKRNKIADCILREKARPSRRVLTGATLVTTGSKRPRCLSSVDSPPRQPSCQRSKSAQRDLPNAHAAQPRLQPIYDTAPRTDGSSSPIHIAFGIPSSFDLQRPLEKAVRTVERLFEQLAKSRFELDLSVNLPPEHVFPVRLSRRLTLDQIGLAPGHDDSLTRARQWTNSHFGAIHHNTPFLYLPQIEDIASRFLASPEPLSSLSGGPHARSTVRNDEAALLLAVLALGSFRQETWDDNKNSYRHVQTTTPGTTVGDGLVTLDLPSSLSLRPTSSESGSEPYPAGTIPLALFRLAQDELDELDRPSELAVQALFLLHTFVSNTSMGRRSKDFVARAIMMAHEIGLNRRISPALLEEQQARNVREVRTDRAVARRRAVLYLYVYFSDVYLSALDSNPPLIKRHDFDPDVFDPILHPPSSSGLDTPSGSSTSLAAFVDLVRTSGEILETLHGTQSGPGASLEERDDRSTSEMVLSQDYRLDQLRDRLGPDTFGAKLRSDDNVDPSSRGATAGKLLRQIHYNWVRIALRAPFLNHPLLAHSSLAVCATSAISLLYYHRYVINAGLLNLPWMQLRRITTAIHIVFIAYWKGEITGMAAGTGISNALMLLAIMGTRWQSARTVAHISMDLADRSELLYQRVYLPSPKQPIGVQHMTLAGDQMCASATPPARSVQQEIDALLQLSAVVPVSEQNGDKDPDHHIPIGFANDSVDTAQDSLLNWLPSGSNEFVWPEEPVDFWNELIGPQG